jgi:hypothetical protein
MSISAIVNGVMVVGEAIYVANGGPAHIVLLPMMDAGFVRVLSGDSTSEEVETPLISPTTLEVCGPFVMEFVIERRGLDSITAVAASDALHYLQHDDQDKPRIGAVKAEEMLSFLSVHFDSFRLDRLMEDLTKILRLKEISSFSAKDAGTSCVVRKTGCRAGTDHVTGNEHCDAFSAESFEWRVVAASFSTMMRHFQKSKSDFSWSTEEDSRTIIRLA